MTKDFFNVLADFAGVNGKSRLAAERQLVDGLTGYAAAAEQGIGRSTVKRAADRVIAAHLALAPFLMQRYRPQVPAQPPVGITE